jgi:beta-xylosidase
MDQGRAIMGRESFLAAVQWPDNEWPSIGPVLAQRDLPSLPGQPGADSFTLPSVHLDAWVYLRDPVLEDYDIESSRVTMRARPAGLNLAEDIVSFLGQRPRRLCGTASVTLHRPQASQPEDGVLSQAGLAFYKDEHRFLTVSYDFHANQAVFEGLNAAKFYNVRRNRQIKLQEHIKFQIKYTERSLRFFVRDSEDHWECMEEVDTLIMTDVDFTGPVIGIFAIGDGGEVRFTDFEIDGAGNSRAEGS